jgi:hypothetical protein
MGFILKVTLRHPMYNYFVRLGTCADAKTATNGCSRHKTGTCHCRWTGDGVFKGTFKEATVFPTLQQAIKAKDAFGGNLAWEVIGKYKSARKKPERQ